MIKNLPMNRPSPIKIIERLNKIFDDTRKNLTKKFSLNEILPQRPKRLTIKGGSIKENDSICAGCAKEGKEYCLDLKLDFCLTCKKKFLTHLNVKTFTFLEKKPKEEVILKCIECKKDSENYCKECFNYYCDSCCSNIHKFKLFKNHNIVKREKK